MFVYSMNGMWDVIIIHSNNCYIVDSVVQSNDFAAVLCVRGGDLSNFGIEFALDSLSCGQRGHMARDCTSRVNCRMCGQDGHFTRECPRNGGSAASLIHSRNHEANMFAQERQRVLLQETAGDKLFFIFLPQNDLATCRCVFCRVIYHASLHPCHEGYILPVCDT